MKPEPPSKTNEPTTAEQAAAEAEERRAIEILARRIDQAQAVKLDARSLLHPLAVN